MRILIITPIYRAFDILQRCCEAIDENTASPFFHILVDDNSPTLPPIPISKNRIILALRNDYTSAHHIHIGKCLDLGIKFGRQCVNHDYLFIVESDLIVPSDWDVRLVEELDRLPNAAVVDAFPIDEKGMPTYPATCNGGIAQLEEAEEMNYVDLNCSVLEPRLSDWPWSFADYVSHHDIRFSQDIKRLTGQKVYRTRRVKAVHYAGSSRNLLGGTFGFDKSAKYDPSMAG